MSKLIQDYSYNGNNRTDGRKSPVIKSVESGITFDLQPLLKSREEALEEIGPKITHVLS